MNKLYCKRSFTQTHLKAGFAKKKQKQKAKKNHPQGQDFLVFLFALLFRVLDRLFFANKNKSHTQKANNECRLSLFRNMVRGFLFRTFRQPRVCIQIIRKFINTVLWMEIIQKAAFVTQSDGVQFFNSETRLFNTQKQRFPLLGVFESNN